MSSIEYAKGLLTIILALGFIMLSLLILTVVVYWLFLDNRIKNKKEMLAFLKPKYKIVVYTVLYCMAINLILSLIVEFAIMIDISSIGNVLNNLK